MPSELKHPERTFKEENVCNGNAAKMREALERLDEHLHEDDYDGHLFFDIFDYDPKEEIRTALSAPPRNCDVGTADEQAERFEALCHRYDNCTSCPIHAKWGKFAAGKTKSCQTIWGQMPFTPEEEGSK